MTIWDDEPSTSAEIVVRPSQPMDLMQQDLYQQEHLSRNVQHLYNTMELSHNLSQASFKIVDYVPDFTSMQDPGFWTQKVLPTLTKALSEDIEARNAVNDTISAISDLSITILKSGTTLAESKGSNRAIEIVRKNIPEAMERIKRLEQRVLQLQLSAIPLFQQYATQFFEIIGPEAANFVKRKEGFMQQIHALEEELTSYVNRMAADAGAMEKYSNLIHATESRLKGADQAKQSTQARAKEMEDMNKQVEATVAAIPQFREEDVTVTRRGGFFWFSHKTTETHKRRVANPDSKTERDYYHGVAMARQQRIAECDGRIAKQDEVVKQVASELSNYKDHYTAAVAKHKHSQEEFQEKVGRINEERRRLYKEIEKLNKSSDALEGQMGLNGGTLIDCLVAIRSFTKAHKEEAQMFAPLAGCLSGICAMVQSDIDMLSGDDKDVFVGQKRLMTVVGMLVNFTGHVRAIGSMNEELNAKALTTEYRTLQIKAQ